MPSSVAAETKANEMQSAGPAVPTPEQSRGMRSAILGQCSGYVAHVAFSNGLILLYLNSRHISSANILVLIALPELFVFLLSAPCSYWCDRLGSKRMGIPGLFLTVIGFALLPISTCFDGLFGDALACAGIVVYSVGFAVFGSGWFALLMPLVPAPMRGRFFGKLRFSWQLVGLIVGSLSTLALSDHSLPSAHRLVLGGFTAGLILRIFFYSNIPQLYEPKPGPSFRRALGDALVTPGYLSFCCYIFMLSLFTMSCPSIFLLIQKGNMHLGDAQVIWLSNSLMVGSMFGFIAGGKAVDRFGTKPVFLTCHFSLALVLMLFLARELLPVPALVTIGVLNFMLGFALSVSNIAISTETLALLPAENRALAVSVSQVLYNGGKALSGLLSSWALKLGILAEAWTLLGAKMSAYDTILLVCAVMLVLLVVTLGLVPSVIRKAEWIPKA